MKSRINIALLFLLVSYHTDISAQFNFQRLIGSTGNDRAQSVFSTFDNGYIVNGASLSFGAGNADAILIKTDNLGQPSWSFAYGTTEYDNSENAVETFDHNIICSGRSNIQPGLPTSAIIFKTDPNGQLLWSKSYGGTGNDDLVQILETSDHGYAAVGFTQSLSSGANDILLVRTDIIGDTIFTRSFGTIEDEYGAGIIQLPDNGFLITGRQITYPGGQQESDGLLLRTDASGNLLWTKIYGDSLWEELSAARILSDGGFIITGSTSTFGAGNYDILEMRTDSGGSIEWSKTFGKDWTDAGYDIHITADSSYVISGYTESLGYGHLLGNDSANIFLLKTNSSGDFLWMNTFGDGLQDEAFRSSKASDGGYLIGGFTTNYHLTNGEQMIVIKTDSLGQTGCHEQNVIPIDSVITMPFGTYSLIQLSGLSTGTFTLTQTTIVPQNEDACIYTNVNNIGIAKNEFYVFPNPFGDLLKVETESVYANEIILYDLFSRKIISEKFNQSVELNTAGLASGIYFFEIHNENGSVSKGKIIKE